MFLGLQGTNLHRAPVTVPCSVLHTCVLVSAFRRWLAGLRCARVARGGRGADLGFARGAELAITGGVVVQPRWKSTSCSYAKGCLLPQWPV